METLKFQQLAYQFFDFDSVQAFALIVKGRGHKGVSGHEDRDVLRDLVGERANTMADGSILSAGNGS